MKVLLACQTATNKGDRAIAEYLLSQFTSLGHEVVLSTTRPELWETEKNHQVKVIEMGYKSLNRLSVCAPLKKVFRIVTRLICDKMLYSSLIAPKGKHRLCQLVSKEFISEVKSADLVIVTGGHHITSIREKNALFQFTYDIGLISLYAKRYVLWAQTIGPLEFTSEKAKNFIRSTIEKAEKVFIRDENSLLCVENLCNKTNYLVKTYDSVFGYGTMEFPDVVDREKKVGIAIFDGLKKALRTFDTIAKMLDIYAEQGYQIEFFRMEHNDYELDNIRQVISHMDKEANITIYPFMSTTEAHLKEVASCRCFIGYKTHSVIMALTTATPLIAIAYHKKTADFMNDFGLGEYVISDEELDLDKARLCIKCLDDNLHNIQQKQRIVARQIAERLKKDMGEMIDNDK